ncbi:MAG: 2-dehydro-3-deoxy-6-phosphogalactonate aldolase [Geminicoccaceae bacterium]
MNSLDDALDRLPLVAILRGLQPARAIEVGEMLVDAGFRIIEVPLNSPQPLQSIERLANVLGGRAIIGAGTVLQSADISAVARAGGRLIVMPHADGSLIRQVDHLGLFCIPGVATPTEAFAALEAGADALKMFPAEAMPPVVVKAWRAVIRPPVRLLPVGGITPDGMAAYLEAGASGFGLGSALFKADLSLPTLAANAKAFVDAIGTISQRPPLP